MRLPHDSFWGTVLTGLALTLLLILGAQWLVGGG